ncbi:hypothetical protein DUNSADRAFT_6197 [Dunaliella salina]|uniref:CDT1 Geminin-binding domain-containing protein n=1 Tax=Dunaliella salina TaxID=3046 RepID=A0ABQ7GNS3_DUNSA|nr:hypothetical protein DUNSADRAFT_6197 [Dunaliella salina]|eukprot:KAF5836245.1 hypothetical protein DUNSADRAFT_6197 [Dunaliella salina]
MSKRSRGAAMLLAAGGSLPDPPPASSPKPCLASGSPNTSPASKRHAADKQTGTTTPQGIPETQPTPKGLPEHLKRLQAVFELMLSGRGLLKRRAEKITATTLAPIVESVTKRNFKVEYVQQIKFLYPEAFDWQYVRVPSEHDKNRLDFQLLLQFERCTAPGGASCPSDVSNSMGNCSNSVARINEAAERAELLARATAWFEAQQVPVQPISASPATPASSQHHTRPQGGTPASGGSRRQSLLSRFMSPQSLEALQRNAQKAQQSPALKAQADLLQSQRMLPQAMDLVRAVFGLKGPVVKQREELVELMRQKSSLSIALSSSEAARALQQLLQHAPEMISQEPQGGVWVIRLRRTADVNAVRTRLCSIACQAARSSTASSPTK